MKCKSVCSWRGFINPVDLYENIAWSIQFTDACVPYKSSGVDDLDIPKENLQLLQFINSDKSVAESDNCDTDHDRWQNTKQCLCCSIWCGITAIYILYIYNIFLIHSKPQRLHRWSLIENWWIISFRTWLGWNYLILNIPIKCIAKYILVKGV